MKIAKIRPVDIIALLLFVILFGYMLTNGILAITHGQIKNCTESLKQYIAVNDGKLPQSKDELYSLPHGKLLKKFTVNLNISVDHIGTLDKKLYDKNTGQQVFILDGLFRRQLIYYYEEASFDLYQEMVKYDVNCHSVPTTN